MNLADNDTRRWIESAPLLNAAVRELLLSPDTHQRALVEADTVACVLHDFQRDFDLRDTGKVGALRIALTPSLMVTARLHPLRSPDIIRQRLARAAPGTGGPQALDLLVSSIAESIGDICRVLNTDVQRAEDALLLGHFPPSAQDLLGIRRRLAQIHRLLSDMRGVFQRLERDEELAPGLLPTVEKLVQHLHALDADIVGTQAQVRLLREELDIQAAQRTNQNLYILSIVTALMLPATLVTGIFGMNTGGMLFAGTTSGTLLALGIVFAAAIATFLLLRWMGFMRL